MIKAIARELELRHSYLENERVDTIYFGGGTPSLLHTDELHQLIALLTATFDIASEAEVTLEANPDDISMSALVGFQKAGINRLSLGTQSFYEPHLKLLNRSHSAGQSLQSLALIKDAGFVNYSADLIYAMPYRDHSVWLDDIDQMLSFHPPHLSCYNLTIEEKTVLGRWSKTGRFEEADDQFAYEQFDLLMDRLAANGYEHYEISNFSRPGYQSKHNSSYWSNANYLGLGPGAHSYNQHSRQYNVSNNALYIKAITSGRLPAKIESLTRTDHINEMIMTRIRTAAGIDLALLKAKWGYDLMHEQASTLGAWHDSQHLISQDNHIRLTRKGKFLADKITEDLFIA